VSLIDDALKRAQSAQGASPARAGHTPLPLPDARRGRRRRLGRYALFVLAPLAAAAVLLVLWPRPTEEAARSEAPALAPPAAEATAPAARTEAPEITPRLAPDISREVFVPPPAGQPSETFSKSPPVEKPVPPPPAPAPAGGAVSNPAPRQTGVSVTRIEPPGPPMVASGSPMIVRSEEARPAPPARGRPFVREATTPSGARLSLDGIVFSDENPAAVVNGRVVSVGSFIEGCEVVRIRPDRVELEERGTAIVLLLK
jgi:hypothetical protein